MGRVRHELWLFGKAQMSAQIATLIDFITSLMLAEAIGLWYVLATFLGALTGGVANCCINYRWVFDAHGARMTAISVKYLLVWTGSLGLNTLGTYILTEYTGYHFIIAKALTAIMVGIFWNYLLQRNFVYR